MPDQGVHRCTRPACSLGCLRSSHLPINHGRVRERVGTQAWAWQSMRGRACVDMRGPTPGLQRTCDVACLHSCEGLGCAKHRPLSQLVGDLRARTTDASFSSGARRWSMRKGTRRGHTWICLLVQLEYRVSSEPSSGRATRLTPPSSAPAARPSRTSARNVVA